MATKILLIWSLSFPVPCHKCLFLSSMGSDQDQKHSSSWFRAFIIVFGLAGLALAGVALTRGLLLPPRADSMNSRESASGVTLTKEKETASGAVLGEQDSLFPGSLKSENYTLGQVSLGGETGVSNAAYDVSPLEIFSVRGISFIEKGKKDVNILITWNTNNPALSKVSYGKNGSDLNQMVEEDGYGVQHNAVLSHLDQSTTYIYRIVARDRFGNEVSSERYAVYTGARITSLFDLISGAINDVFGWAIKR